MFDASQVRTWLELTTDHGIASGNLVRDLAESWLALHEELAQVKASLGGKLGKLSEENYKLSMALEHIKMHAEEVEEHCIVEMCDLALGGR